MLWGDHPGPTLDAVFAEEILRVLAGNFDLVEGFLGEGDRFRGILHRWRMGCGRWFREFR